jgi:FtsZ-binding cell division protein ZapB
METVKLTQEEIEKIQQLKDKFNEAISTIGLLQYQIVDLQDRKAIVEAQLLQMRNQEQELYKQLVDNYGEGTLSLETGELVKN